VEVAGRRKNIESYPLETNVVTMRIFITGGVGLLGSKLARITLDQGHEVFTGYNHNLPDQGEPVKFDLTTDSSINNAVDLARPEVIFHTAALTDVDKCEMDRDLACRINAKGTKILAAAAKSAGSFLTYISTDYVFNGSRGMYREDDAPDPISHYGYTKLLGEKYADCVARTCVIYGSRPASGKVNFALWIIDNLQKGESIRIVTDQYISPTLNTNLAMMLLEAGEKKLEGIYHLAGAERISRYDYACRLADVFGLDKSLIAPSRMADIGWKAKRPMDSSMDVSKATQILKEKPWNIDKSFRVLKEETS
jgi:dTDP-4-dehydrorhamnose reductase